MAARTAHVPLRRCVSCRRALPQRALTRFRRNESGEWLLDTARSGGRGAWVCQEENCRTSRALGRFFRAQAPRIAEQLRERDEDGGLNDREG